MGTAKNTGNVRLRQLALWPSSLITADPTCHIRLSNSSSTDLNAPWVPPSDVAVGHEVECTVSFPIGQDGLEAAAVDTNGAPVLLLAMAVNATATDELHTLEQSQDVAVTVSHQPSMSLQLHSDQCLVPTEPGEQGARALHQQPAYYLLPIFLRYAKLHFINAILIFQNDAMLPLLAASSRTVPCNV